MKKFFHRTGRGAAGFTIVELMVSIVVFAIVALSFLGLFVSLVHSALVAKQKAVASTLATDQMEYLKSLPYDSLAIAGGAIYSTNPLVASSVQKVNGTKYTVTTSINYVDDAYDGCASYPSVALKQAYCRNYPPPASAPSLDTNPADYKDVYVAVTGPGSIKLASVDTQISARVSETASTTGALLVKIVDQAGNPIDSSNVIVSNSMVSPVVNVSDATDSNGIAIFYGLPPDSNANDYTVSANKTGYSSLATIVPSGSLQPTYPSQKILTQQSSYVTLTLKQQGPNSLILEAVGTTGSPIGGAKIYVKGGYKKYTATTDATYYYDGLTPTDNRPTTDSSGLAALSNLVPGTYAFCGDSGASSCVSGTTTYYLAAAVPYSGSNAFNPINVPTYDPAHPPTTTFTYGTTNFYQKVRLILTTSSTFPRITNLSPSQVSLANDPLSTFAFMVVGVNLPCSSTASSCATTVKFIQGSSTYTASCTGAATGLQLSCKVNLTGITVGSASMTVVNGSNTLTLPATPLIGGFIVTL